MMMHTSTWDEKQELKNVRLSQFLVVSSTEWKRLAFKRGKMRFTLIWDDVFPLLRSQRREISTFVLAQRRQKRVL